jgi:cell wall-associated NlpC family hydrolase
MKYALKFFFLFPLLAASGLLKGQDSFPPVSDTLQDWIQVDSVMPAGQIGKIDYIINFSEKFIGTPYRYGGKQPGGFDCSGFVCYVYGQLGYKMPASSSLYNQFGTAVPKRAAQPGDVICFKGRNMYASSIGHVGIITEANAKEIYFIHASVNKGITVDKLSSEYYRNRLVQIRRVLR